MRKHSRQHLAIFNGPFLELILEGKKTVEGRFSRVRCAPFGSIREGDNVLMKKSGGLIIGSFVVLKVETYDNLTPKKLNEIKQNYGSNLCADADPNYWELRKSCKYATILHISEPIRFPEPFPIEKRDRRGWLVINDSNKNKYNFNLWD